MKSKRALAISVGLVALVCVYGSYALRCYYLAPSLELPEDLHAAPRAAIEEWYEDAEDIPSPEISKIGVIYALMHPYNPHKARCAVDLNNKGVIHVYCDVRGGYIAFFAFEDDRWKFNGSGNVNDILEPFKFNK